jgi:hypothetical protein
MNSKEQLQTAIIRYVMETMGFWFDSEKIVSRLMQNASTQIPQTLKVEVDGTPTKKGCWCAELPVASLAVRAIVTDLTDGDIREHAAVFRVGDNPPYGMRLSTDPLDVGDFLVRGAGGRWNPVPTLLQATCLTGIEKLAVVSLNWQKNQSSDELYGYLVEFLKAGES